MTPGHSAALAQYLARSDRVPHSNSAGFGIGERLDATTSPPPQPKSTEEAYAHLLQRYRARLAAGAIVSDAKQLGEWVAVTQTHDQDQRDPEHCRSCRATHPCVRRLGALAGLEAAGGTEP